MSVYLELRDVLDMAQQIERDAAAFYRQAASAARASASRKVLLDLAEMEAEHEHTFAGLKAQWISTRAEGEGLEDLPSSRNGRAVTRVLASGVQDDLARRFTGRETGEQIVRKALEFEKDSIVFYVGMKAALADAMDAPQIDAIIREELGHILTLTGELASPSPFAPPAATPTPAPRAPAPPPSLGKEDLNGAGG